jgi:hypothetical protein
MTPDQVAAELTAVAAAIGRAWDDHDRDWCTESLNRLTTLAGQITASVGTPDTAPMALSIDGPHSDDYTADVARLAAEAVRVLNHATGYHTSEGLTYPATAYRIAGNLAAAAFGTGQLTDQMVTFLDRELAAGRLGDDSGLDPVIAVERARRHLEAARVAGHALWESFAATQSALSGLHSRAGGAGR